MIQGLARSSFIVLKLITKGKLGKSENTKNETFQARWRAKKSEKVSGPCNYVARKSTYWIIKMKTQRRSRIGRYALLIGMAAGFAFLASFFRLLDKNSISAGAVMWLAITVCSLSTFLIAMEQKDKTC
jgi:xanthine/uracil permease